MPPGVPQNQRLERLTGGPIVVVEDNDGLRDVMQDWLETVFLECEVIVASHDNRAIRIAEARSPSLILVDVDALSCRGVEAIARLHRVAPDAGIIALTLDDHEALRRDIASAGAAACVRKAQISDELLPIMKEILGPACEPRWANGVLIPV